MNTFYNTQFTSIPGEAVSCVLQVLELFRRFVWNFIRLENEHLNNCGQFRIVRDISIAPVGMKVGFSKSNTFKNKS